MLSELQSQLNETYRVGGAHDVRDFLITDRSLAQLFGQDALLSNSEETLFIAQDDDGIAMSLYLDAEMLERLESSDPLTCLQADAFADFCNVLEGISHFNCMAFKAASDREVSLLELELQGEVDKFVSSLQLALKQSDHELLGYLYGWLFDNVRFHDELRGEALDRYRAANDFASRFCYALQQQFLLNPQAAIDELRQFFRLPIADKISHINAKAW